MPSPSHPVLRSAHESVVVAVRARGEDRAAQDLDRTCDPTHALLDRCINAG